MGLLGLVFDIKKSFEACQLVYGLLCIVRASRMILHGDVKVLVSVQQLCWYLWWWFWMLFK
jgi:hypothetical protein